MTTELDRNPAAPITPDHVPAHLRPFYVPPLVADVDAFTKHANTLISFTGGVYPDGLPTRAPYEETVYIYPDAWELALPRIDVTDKRWAEYLQHKAEKPPQILGTEEWLQAFPLKATRDKIVQAIRQDYDNRHEGRHPQQTAYEMEWMRRASQVTGTEIRKLWDKNYGVPRAERRWAAAGKPMPDQAQDTPT